MNNVIEFNKVSKYYQHYTMNEVSFKVPKGYITGFIGPNGSGKTTTIKMLLDLVFKDNGHIKLFNEDITLSNHEDIGLVLDDGFLLKDWRIKDLNELMPHYYSKWNKDTFYQHLRNFSLEDTYKIKELSRGMSVKLYLSIALSHDAKLLILDEPTSGLDPSAREEICELLQNFIEDEDKTVFFSTHITSDLESIADYIVFILNGKIIYEGEKDELLVKYKLVKGGLDDLKDIDSHDLIGIKKQSTHFEALCLSSFKSNLDLVYETASLDDLIKFYHREEKHEENI